MSNHPGKQFSSTYQPANAGRKPSKLKKYIKDNNMGSQDVSLIIKNVIFSKSEEELGKLLKDKTAPMIVRLFIKAYLTDLKNGSLVNLEVMLNRTFGKPDQNINANVNNSHSVADIPREERDRMLKELLEKQGYKKDESDSDQMQGS